MIKAPEDRIILQVEKNKEQKTSGGLIFTNISDVKNKATVIAVGEGRLLSNGKRIAPEVEVGQKVVFNIHAVQAMTFENEDYLCIFSKDILAIIEETE